jgi:hypothetical protein
MRPTPARLVLALLIVLTIAPAAQAKSRKYAIAVSGTFTSGSNGLSSQSQPACNIGLESHIIATYTLTSSKTAGILRVPTSLRSVEARVKVSGTGSYTNSINVTPNTGGPPGVTCTQAPRTEAESCPETTTSVTLQVTLQPGGITVQTGSALDVLPVTCPVLRSREPFRMVSPQGRITAAKLRKLKVGHVKTITIRHKQSITRPGGEDVSRIDLTVVLRRLR